MLEGHRPRRVHLRAERREHAHAPVADLVAEPLHHDRAVVGHHAGGLGLLVEVGDEVRGRPVVEPAGAEPLDRVAGAGAQLAGERADGATELERATGAVAVPERHLPGLPGRRRDDHLLEGDVLDAPGGGAEQEGLARAALVHHLLVELAHAGAVGERDGEQPAVGDGAGVGDGQALRTGATADDALRRGPTRCAVAARRTPPTGSDPTRRSSTEASTSSESSANGAELRTTSARSSSFHSSSAFIATICWHSTSSGLRG